MYIYYLSDFVFLSFLFFCLRNIFVSKKQILIPAIFSVILIILLVYFYTSSDTKLINVWMNSNNNTPLIYKISAIWGNHQGSMLILLTMFCFSALSFRKIIPIKISSFFLFGLGLYVFLNANPFTVFETALKATNDLNPALQNDYLTIHPPILYMGYALTFTLWGLALVNYADEQINKILNISFSLILIGIILGSLWAYQELGWGGFWFWDPVEIISLFPLVILGAAIHTANKKLKYWCLISSFPLTFTAITFVRSGFLISIHSFAFDISNSLWLGLLSFFIILITILIGLKNQPEQNINFKKEWPAAIFILFLVVLFLIIITPIVFHFVNGIQINISEEFFKKIINPLLVLILAFSSFAPKLKLNFKSLLLSFLVTFLWSLNFQPETKLFAVASSFVSFFIIFSLVPHFKNFLKKGFVFAHLGIALAILGASHTESFTFKKTYLLKSNDFKLGNYSLTFNSQNLKETSNTNEEIFIFLCDDKKIKPKIIYYKFVDVYKNKTDWIIKDLNNIHAVVFLNNNSLEVEFTLKPLINLLWLGLLMIILGSVISVFNSFKKKSFSSIT